MSQTEFGRPYRYSGPDDSVLLPVVLRAGGIEVEFAAGLDTGASCCLFRSEIAAGLGLHLEGGLRTRFRTANSDFEAYGHQVEINVLGTATYSLVYFFADPQIKKNVLRRTGWLDRVRLGLVHHDNTIYLAPYDES